MRLGGSVFLRLLGFSWGCCDLVREAMAVAVEEERSILAVVEV